MRLSVNCDKPTKTIVLPELVRVRLRLVEISVSVVFEVPFDV